MNEAYYTYSFGDKQKQNYIFISPKDRLLYPFKIKLLYSRRYFHNHPFTFLSLKFLLGLILFTLPIFLFCFIIKQTLDYRKYEHFWTATLSLNISVVVVMIYILGIFIYRITQMCSNNR